jgi:hypothetical protein
VTEEQMIASSQRLWNRTRPHLYSGLCELCGDVFWARRKTASFCTRSCARKKLVGPLNPNWRGGRVPANYGYMRVYSGPGGTINGRYMAEHRAVMEKVIGRRLEKFENVHHKNGIRDDNRPENLELWATAQCRGQRVSDLVQFVFDNYNAEIRGKIAVQDAVLAVIERVTKETTNA